jgi:hypothetical protein
MLAPPADLNPFFNIGGKQNLVATFGLQYLFAGDPSLGSSFKFAKPHDTLWLYGIGFGAVQEQPFQASRPPRRAKLLPRFLSRLAKPRPT